MIQLSGLTKIFGDRVLLENITWQIGSRDRIGLCGPNGAGKTTLLKILAGFEEVDAGAVIRPAALTVGYLPQDGLTHAGRSVFEEASLAFQPLLEIRAEMGALEARLGDPSIPEPEHDAMLERYSDLQDRFRLNEGYSLELKVATVLRGLGFGANDFERKTETFSGGWQMRLALAKLLLGQPTLLLLDEPTNHLDLDARNWLEEYLASYPHSVILVSHDRFFLDAVVTRITDLFLRKLTDYFGTYSEYLVEREARVGRLRRAKREQDEEVARVKQFIDRFRYQATKASQVQSRIKLLDKIVPIEVPPERKRIHFTFPPSVKSGRTVLELTRVRKAYGELVVLREANLHVERGDRIALIGPNGVGKSTLMRILAGVESPDAGTRQEGHQVVVQYFAQDEANRLDPGRTVYETLASGSPNQMIPAIRNILGGFLFSGDDVYKRVSVLSGGERTRLAVARMLLRPSNTLLLDEPTNHLDLDSKEVLLDALVDYGGTLIFVTHDRYFIDRLATKVVQVGDGDAVVYPGTYEELVWRKQHPDTPQSAVAEPSRRPARRAAPVAVGRPVATHSRRRPAQAAPVEPRAAAPGPTAPAGHEARKKATADARKHRRATEAQQVRIAALEAQIASCEQSIRDIETSMATPGFYDDLDAARPLIDRHQALMWQVGDLMHQWEELHNTSAFLPATSDLRT